MFLKYIFSVPSVFMSYTFKQSLIIEDKIRRNLVDPLPLGNLVTLRMDLGTSTDYTKIDSPYDHFRCQSQVSSLDRKRNYRRNYVIFSFENHQSRDTNQ